MSKASGGDGRSNPPKSPASLDAQGEGTERDFDMTHMGRACPDQYDHYSTLCAVSHHKSKIGSAGE